MDTLKNRLANYVDEKGVKITHIAEESNIPVKTLYNLRSGVQESLGETHAINLHKFLDSEGY